MLRIRYNHEFYSTRKFISNTSSLKEAPKYPCHSKRKSEAILTSLIRQSIFGQNFKSIYQKIAKRQHFKTCKRTEKLKQRKQRSKFRCSILGKNMILCYYYYITYYKVIYFNMHQTHRHCPKFDLQIFFFSRPQL